MACLYANSEAVCENTAIKVKADDSLDVMIKPVTHFTGTQIIQKS
jgi:hypothetical protein